MNLLDYVKKLAGCEPAEAPFISLYLNVKKDKAGRREFEAFLSEKLNFFRDEFSGSTAEDNSFLLSWEPIQQFLEQKLDSKSKGVALFSRWQPEGAFFLPLRFLAPLENRFVVDRVPHIFPLVQFLDNSHHYMVMISDSEKAKIYEIQFGGIEELHLLQKLEDEKSFRGEWSQMHYQNWKKDKTRRFVKKKIEILADLMQRKGVKHLILAGDEVILAQIKQQLPKWLQDRVIDFARLDMRMDESKIIRQTLETFAEFERAEDLDAIASLQHAMATNGLGVLGTLNTLEVLNQDKIDQLIIAAGFKNREGWQCQTCSSLGMGRRLRTTCYNCGQATLSAVNLKEEMVRKALRNGASVESISNNEWLMKYGGVGALLRYK